MKTLRIALAVWSLLVGETDIALAEQRGNAHDFCARYRSTTAIDEASPRRQYYCLLARGNPVLALRLERASVSGGCTFKDDYYRSLVEMALQISPRFAQRIEASDCFLKVHGMD